MPLEHQEHPREEQRQISYHAYPNNIEQQHEQQVSEAQLCISM